MDLEEVNGIFKKYSEDNNKLLFAVNFDDEGDLYEEVYEFVINDKKVQTKYNFYSNEFIGKKFRIKFTVNVNSELNEEDGIEEFYEVYTIKEIYLLE